MSLHDDASLATVLAQLDDSTNQTWKAKRSGWAKLVRAQAAELERLRAALVEAEHAMTKARVWGGMAWHYNPLHPMHYVPALEAIRAALQPETAP